MGAASAANTGAAGAMHRVGFFAAKAAPTLSAPTSRHAQISRSGLVSRWGAKRPQVFSFAAKIAGAAARPIATQGRSYKGQCWLAHRVRGPLANSGLHATANAREEDSPGTQVTQVSPRVDTPLMPIAEHKLHAISLRLDMHHAHIIANQADVPLQPCRSALRAGASTAQAGMAEAMFAVLPLQHQLPRAAHVAKSLRGVHQEAPRSCAMAIRTALRTSGSLSASAACSTGKARAWPSSPRARAASLRRLAMLWPSNSPSASSAAA